MSIPTENLMRTFDVYDLERTQKIPIGDVASVLRSCGFFCTRGDMTTLLEKYAAEKPPVMTRDQFSSFISTLPAASFKVGSDDLLVALRAFDYHEGGTLTSDEISNLFTRLKDHIAMDELNRILEGGPKDAKGACDIQQLAEYVLRSEKEYKLSSAQILGELKSTPEL